MRAEEPFVRWIISFNRHPKYFSINTCIMNTAALLKTIMASPVRQSCILIFVVVIFL